jgi:hypothetical protein
MNLLLILVPISFVIGLVLGFYLYIYLYLPQYLETFTNVIPFASIFTMVGVIVKLVSEWNKKLHLKFEEIIKENNVYFIKINKVRGEQAAEDCEGLLNTKDVNDYVSVWRFGNERIKTIYSRDFLRLFELKNGEIIFPSASTDKNFQDTNNPFAIKSVKMTDYINENLTVTVGSRNGNNLETTLLISDIISCKNPNKSYKERFLNRLNVCIGKK